MDLKEIKEVIRGRWNKEKRRQNVEVMKNQRVKKEDEEMMGEIEWRREKTIQKER